MPVADPATGHVIGPVPALGLGETRRAVAAAARMLPASQAKTAREPAAILRRRFELVTAHAGDSAHIMTREQGKALAEAKGGFGYGASFNEWFAQEAKRTYGAVIPQTVDSRRISVLKQPFGVCAAIQPWNLPYPVIIRNCKPTIAAGCTMIARPASATPSSALALAELAEPAGVPRRVFDVVTGPSVMVGTELTTHKTFRELSFTGSTEVGQIALKQATDAVKPVSATLRRHAPFIVFDDGDIEAAVRGARLWKFRNWGQTSVRTNRIYAHERTMDSFSRRRSDAVVRLEVGLGAAPGVEIGPAIDDGAVTEVRQQVSDVVTRGGVTTGGKRHAVGRLFFEPTVLANRSSSMRIAYEETFRPVAPLFYLRTKQEVIAMANNSDVRLVDYFDARDIGRMLRVAEALEVGLVGLNDHIISNEVAPFGGAKESGLGREGSKYGIEERPEIEYVRHGGSC